MRTWLERDLPVLRHLADDPPEGAILFTNQTDEPRPGLPQVSELAFHRSVVTLADARYVSWSTGGAEGGGSSYFGGFQVTGAGMQALGEWPLFAALGEPAELAAVLDALATTAATDEEEANVHAAAEAVRGLAPNVLRSLLAGVIGGLVRTQL